MKWIKPSGSTIETNDLPDTIEAAMSHGWKKAGLAKKKTSKKKTAKKA